MKRSVNPRTMVLMCLALLAAAWPVAAADAGPVSAVRSEAGRPLAGNAEAVGRSGGHGDSSSDLRHASPLLLDLSGLVDKGRASGRAARGAGAHCGPALTSAAGLEAQTCVLREAGYTWGRTYYRNGTGAPLRLALALLRDDGRSIAVDCPLPAKERRGVCETPRAAAGPSTGAAAGAAPDTAKGAPAGARGASDTGRFGYSAVAEVASKDGSRMLMRSGSNAGGR
jgi:hypothetical protein